MITLSACNQETEFETVVVSSSDSIQIGTSTDTGSIGDLAPTFEFKNLISGSNYEIHGNNSCASFISSFDANVKNDRVQFKIPEVSLKEAEEISFHLKGSATNGEAFCISLNKKFTYIKNDLDMDVSISLGSGVNPVGNSSSVSLNVSGVNENRVVDIFSDNSCSNRSSNITNYESSTVPIGSNSVVINFDLSSSGSFIFFAKVTNPLSNVSVCSSSSVSYTYDNQAPTISGLMFNSNLSGSFKSFNNAPRLKLMGDFSSGDTVQVFGDESCASSVLNTVNLENGSIAIIPYGSIAIIPLSLSLSSGSFQDLSVKVIDGAGNISSCSSSVTYIKLADSEPVLSQVVNSSGNLGFNFLELTLVTGVSASDYKVKLFPQANDCTGIEQQETMASDKTVTFSNVFSTPGDYSNFSVKLTKDGVNDETTCYSSFSFSRISSSAISLSLPSSSSTGRDLDFSISGIQESGIVYLYQNSGCIGTAWGASTIVNGVSSYISIDNRSIPSPGSYNFSAKLITDGGVDTGCSSPFSHTVNGVSSSWSSSTVEPGFGSDSAIANLSWDFLAGDTIKIYDESSCSGGPVYTEAISSPSSSVAINLQPYLSLGVNTTFSLKVNADRACESGELVFNLIEALISIPTGSSGVSGTPELKVSSLPLNRRLDFYLYNDANCMGFIDTSRINNNLTSDNFFILDSSGRTPLSSLGGNSYSIKLKLYNSTGSESVEKCIGTTNYDLLPSAPTSLAVTNTVTPGQLSFSNTENLEGGQLVIFTGANCETELSSNSYTGGVISYTNTFSSEGSYSFSAKRRKEVSGQNYDSPCSGELATSVIDLTPPGDVSTFSLVTTDTNNLTYGSVDLDFSVVASNFEIGEKISLYSTSDCSGSSLTINDSGTPLDEITISSAGTASLTLKHDPGNYLIDNQSIYLLREDSSGNRNCHSTPANFFIYPQVSFNPATTANPGFGTSVYMIINYALPSNKTILIYKNTDCSGSQITGTVLESAANLQSLGMDFSINSSGNTDYSFKLSGGSCFPFGLTYKILDLALSLPDGISGSDAKPDIQVSGDMSSVNQLSLYLNSSCSGTADVTSAYLTLGESDSHIFGDTSERDNASTGNNQFYVYTNIKRLNGSSLGTGTCLGPLSYEFNDVVSPGAFTSFTISEFSNSRVFENSMNFEFDLIANNFEENEVITIHSDSSCTSSSLVSKTLDSSDVSIGKINLLVDNNPFSGFSFSNGNNRTEERKVYVKRTDSDGNSACFSNESNNEVLDLYIYQTPTLALNYTGTGISAPTDENNLRFNVSNMPGVVYTGTGFTKEVYIYKDPRCELTYGKKYDISYAVKGHGGPSFPELIDRTGTYRLGVRVKYFGVGDLAGSNLVSNCIPANEFEIIPTIINSSSELQSFLSAANVSNLESLGWNGSYKRHLKLNQDIDLSQGDTDCSSMDPTSTNNWTPISNFDGTLDGGGKTICGMSINDTDKNLGLFDTLGKNSVIFNLHFVKALITNNSISSTYSTGVLAGKASGSIERVLVDVSSIVLGNHNLGGLVGVGDEIFIRKSSSSADVKCINFFDTTCGDGTKGTNIGGLVGKLMGSENFPQVPSVNEHPKNSGISNSFADGNVSGREKVGGLIGYSEGTVIYSYSAGTVTGAEKVGGLIGEVSNDATFSAIYSFSAANITPASGVTVAGLIGLSSNMNCVYKGWHTSEVCFNKNDFSSSDSNRSFPSCQDVGDNGECYNSLRTTLAASITDSVTSINVTDSSLFLSGDEIRVGNEQMLVSSVSTGVLVVTRAEDSTTASSHSLGDNVFYLNCDDTSLRDASIFQTPSCDSFNFNCTHNWLAASGNFPVIRQDGGDYTSQGFSISERGTREAPLLVETTDDWLNISEIPDILGAHIEIRNDLDFPDQGGATNFQSLTEETFGSYFSGVLNGNHFRLNGIDQNVVNSPYKGGLVPRTSGGTIKNIFIENANFNYSNSNFGSVISKYSIASDFKNLNFKNINLSVDGTFNSFISSKIHHGQAKNIRIQNSQINSTDSSSEYNGFVAGGLYVGKIKNINIKESSMMNVSNYSGGLVGWLYGESDISHSEVDINIVGSATEPDHQSIGGVIGANILFGRVDNVKVSGSITGTGDKYGGVVGTARYVYLNNILSEIMINGSETTSDRCSPGVAYSYKNSAEHHQTWVTNSIFLGPVTCNGINDYAISNWHTPTLDSSDNNIDNNFYLKASPAKPCHREDSPSNYVGDRSPPCLDLGSIYVLDNTTEVENFFINGGHYNSRTSNGLGWSQETWIKEGNALPKLKIFNP